MARISFAANTDSLTLINRVIDTRESIYQLSEVRIK